MNIPKFIPNVIKISVFQGFPYKTAQTISKQFQNLKKFLFFAVKIFKGKL